MAPAADSWSRLELRYLAALEAIADERSFGRAADRLGYTQSAVSQQIAALERIVGARLFNRPRGHRTLSLTDAGELLLRHARGIRAHTRAAHADLSALRDGDAGLLRIGAFQSVAGRILPLALGQLRNECPGVEVRLHHAVCDLELQELVVDGELDLAFATLPALDGPLEAVELLRDPYVLAVSAGSSLADRDRPPAADEMAALPLAVLRADRESRSAEEHLRAHGIVPSVALRTDDGSTVQGLVAQGVCAGLVPLLAVDPANALVRTVQLEDLVPPRVIGLVRHEAREMPNAARSFVAAARAASRGIAISAGNRAEY